MVQPVEQLSPRRRRTRIQRTRRYLETASRIVFDEGIDALTMQRLATDLDCAVGTVYRYFPSKDALVAALQREAIETLIASYRAARPGWNSHINAVGLSSQAAVLLRALAFGEFCIDASDTFPAQFHLLRQLMSDPRRLVSADEAEEVMPAAMTLLDIARRQLTEAADAGAIERGDDMQRALMWAVALTGAIGVDKLARFDPTIFDANRLARAANRDLFRGWGADPDALGSAAEQLNDLRSLGPLANPVPGDIERLIT